MEPNAQELLRRFSHLAAENRLPHACLLYTSSRFFCAKKNGTTFAVPLLLK